MSGRLSPFPTWKITNRLFTTQYLSKKWDILQAIDPEAMLNSYSSSEEDNANSLDEKYGKEKRDMYPLAEAKKNPEASGKLLEQPNA